MGYTLWNLYILVTMAQVPPLARPTVVVGVLYLDIYHLAVHLLGKHSNSESWA